MALKDLAIEIDRCSACSYCKWIPFDQVKSWRYAKNCPSISYFNFNSYSARGRYLVARSLNRGFSEITDQVVEIAHTCMECGSCDVSCKICRYNLEPLNMVRELKFEMVANGKYPKVQDAFLKNISETANCFGKPRTDRGNWAEGLGLKDLAKEKGEVLFHAGCSYSYDPALQKTVRTAAEILKNAGVDFGILGNAEVCCGRKAFSMGHKETFEKQAKTTIKLWENAGVKTVVTACADGYHAFKRLYPEYGSKVKVLHFVEYVDMLIKEGKLKLTKKVPMKVTYHDPCLLGRQGEAYVPWDGKEVKLKNQIVSYEPRKPRYNGIYGIYDEPRNILEAIPGLELVEMERIREYSWCCGAGGGARETYPDYSQWTAEERVQEATDTGAEAIVTACPWCVTNLKDGLKVNGNMTVLDIVDVVKMAIE